MVILVLNICKERLHYYEFVRPIEDILRKGGFGFDTFHYSEEIDFSKYDKVIISGTSLEDNDFLDNLERFDWLKDFNGEVFGICAGFQILGRIFGVEVKRGEVEIGFFRESFKKEIFGLKGEVEVYHLHGNYLEIGEDWEIFSDGKIAQAIKLKSRGFYGLLFHPEVRNKKMILRFAR